MLDLSIVSRSDWLTVSRRYHDVYSWFRRCRLSGIGPLFPPCFCQYSVECNVCFRCQIYWWRLLKRNRNKDFYISVLFPNNGIIQFCPVSKRYIYHLLSSRFSFFFFSLQNKTWSWFRHWWLRKRRTLELQTLPPIYPEHDSYFCYITWLHARWSGPLQHKSVQIIWL